MPTARARRTVDPNPPRSRAKTWWILGGALAVLLTGALLARHFLADSRTRHSLPVAYPENAPHGEPLAIGHAVKAGDVFQTDVTFESGIMLAFDPPDPFQGMK